MEVNKVCVIFDMNTIYHLPFAIQHRIWIWIRCIAHSSLPENEHLIFFFFKDRKFKGHKYIHFLENARCERREARKCAEERVEK